MKNNLDDLEDINDIIDEKDTTKNDTPNSFLKIEPIKTLDSSSIEIEIPKISTDKQTKDKKEEPKIIEDDFQNDSKEKDNSKLIKIALIILIAIVCISVGYFVYSKFMDKDEDDFVNDIVTQKFIQDVELANKENFEKDITDLAALGETIVENLQETVDEEEPSSEEIIIQEENNLEEQTVVQVENTNQASNDYNDYDLDILEKVYDEVINKGNEAYLNNFSSKELAIIRNTLYARKGYKFKKKIYQQYFGQKSWYNPTTSSQNILTKKEEKLANIIKKYE